MTGRLKSLVLVRLAALLLLAMAAALVQQVSVAAPSGEGTAPAVQIYTTKSCRYCKLLRRYLDARGIPYLEHDINATPEARQAFYASGAQGVPLVVIGTRRIQGFNPFALESALDSGRAEPRTAIE